MQVDLEESEVVAADAEVCVAGTEK